MTHDGELRSVPTAPGALPLLGHLWALRRDPLAFLTGLRPTGDLVRVNLGAWPVYFLTDALALRQVLVTQAECARMGGYGEVMNRQARELAESWHAGQVVAVEQAMSDLALAIMGRILFSQQLDAGVLAELRELIATIMKGIPLRMATPSRLDRWPVLPINRRFDRAAARMRHIVADQIAAHRGGEHGVDHAGLLSALPNAGAAAMDERQVCDEAISLLIAGTETPAVTLSWTLHELAEHPDVERDLHAEVDSVVGAAHVTQAHIDKLAFTGRVIQEVLRLHPSLLFTRRTTAQVSLCGVRLPPGTEVAYSPYALHRDPDVFAQPGRFNPDRWLPGSDTPPRDAFLPFGSGQHKCVGDVFAYQELTVAVATIAARWRLRPTSQRRVREVPAQVPHPDALPMIVEPRHRR